MQSCIVTCSSSSSFWRAIISNTQIHVCMRANRNGANNLCNYTQSRHPSPYLCTSCHLDFFAFTQSATTWNDADADADDVDQHHHQIYNFLERSTRIPLRLFCSKNTNRIESNCIAKFLCWSAQKPQDFTSLTWNGGQSALHQHYCTQSLLLCLIRCCPLLLPILPTYLITMRCSKVFITHCDGFSRRVNNMRYNKSFDRWEHTRSTSTPHQKPTTTSAVTKAKRRIQSM